eukprot:7742732-Pyramimonas_sp.AAC.1
MESRSKGLERETTRRETHSSSTFIPQLRRYGKGRLLVSGGGSTVQHILTRGFLGIQGWWLRRRRGMANRVR